MEEPLAEETFPRLLELKRRNRERMKFVGDATEDGFFAVHKSIGEGYTHLWTVTHIPSGTAITDSCMSREAAWRIVKLLRNLPWEWTNVSASYFRERLTEAPMGIRTWIEEIG